MFKKIKDRKLKTTERYKKGGSENQRSPSADKSLRPKNRRKASQDFDSLWTYGVKVKLS